MGLKKDNKRILLMLPYGSVGGMERLALTFYEYYRSLGYFIKAVKFIKLESDIIDFGEDELFLSLKDFNNMSSPDRYSFYLRTPRALRKLIKKYKITHSIAFGDMANLFSSLTFTKEYKIGSVHALKSVELSTRTIFNRLIKLGYKSSYKHLNKLVCISKSIKEDLILNCDYRFDNLDVIYNPHDIKEIQRLSYEKIDDTTEQTLFKEQTILFLGRLSIQKAPWHLINAFNIIKNDFKNVNLIFIGDGDDKVINYIKKLISAYQLEGRIFLFGRKSNPYKYLSQASVLALSSFYEGTPNVIVESIALGTPVVSSNCTRGIAELMSLVKNEPDFKTNVEVAGGIITPNFYKGKLEIPESTNEAQTIEEKLFADALKKMLQTNLYKEKLIEYQVNLLDKFELSRICADYLSFKH